MAGCQKETIILILHNFQVNVFQATSEINMTRGEQSEEPEESSGTVEILERDSVRRGVKREWESTNEVVIKEADKVRLEDDHHQKIFI